MNTENVLDLQQHLNCPYYQKKDSPMFEVINRNAGVGISRKMTLAALVFVDEGEIEFSFNSNPFRTAHRNEFFMLPADTEFTVRFLQSTSLLCFHIAAETDFCWHIRQKLLGYPPSNTDGQNFILSALDIIRKYIDIFLAITGKGVLCVKYLDCQICTLLDLICVFYPFESLIEFFEPLRSCAFGRGINFKSEVLKNRHKLFKVTQFAAATHMSRTTFRRHFERVFGMNPHDWIKQERIKHVEQELKYGILPLQQVAQKTGFVSIRDFYSFCRKNLGKTAMEIRKEGLKL
jgi:AraC-like DNA-binding protein